MAFLTTYVALLRGINVSSQKSIKMLTLRSSFEALGFSGITTYIQSGNVVFKGSTNAAATLAKRIEEQIASQFGFAVQVFLQTAHELSQIAKGNPFLRGAPHSGLYVTFLSAPAPATAAKSLEGLATESERFHISGRIIYLHCPNGYGKTKLSNNTIERKLGLAATTRNWNTVTALLAITQA